MQRRQVAGIVFEGAPGVVARFRINLLFADPQPCHFGAGCLAVFGRLRGQRETFHGVGGIELFSGPQAPQVVRRTIVSVDRQRPGTQFEGFARFVPLETNACKAHQRRLVIRIFGKRFAVFVCCGGEEKLPFELTALQIKPVDRPVVEVFGQPLRPHQRRVVEFETVEVASVEV